MMVKTDTQSKEVATDNEIATGKQKALNKLKSLNPKEKGLFIKLAVCLVVGIVLMVMAKGCTDATNRTVEPASADAATAASPTSDEQALETKLQEILTAIKGAGAVSVAITYEEGPESVYATDSTEKTSDTQKELSTAPAEVNSNPVLLKQRLAKVQGVVIVAQGASDPLVQEMLYRAAKSLLNLNSNQIAVIEGNTSGQ